MIVNNILIVKKKNDDIAGVNEEETDDIGLEVIRCFRIDLACNDRDKVTLVIRRMNE